MNQSSQKGFVAARLVRHCHGLDGLDAFGSSRRSDGTETRADVVLRIVRERVLDGTELGHQRYLTLT
jgi:hypothetical protein